MENYYERGVSLIRILMMTDRPTSKYLPQDVLNSHTNPVRTVGNPTAIQNICL